MLGSPPCTEFSRINLNFNASRVAPEVRRRRAVEARTLLAFAFSVYDWQLRRGRYFLHEHPMTATSWELPEVQTLRLRDGVTSVVGDMCVFNMVVPAGLGGPGLARKPTRWLTNAPELAKRLNHRCSGAHAHAPLVGGRAAHAAIYPPELVAAILQGLRDQWEEDARRMGSH